MKQSKFSMKAMSVLLAFCFVIGSICASPSSAAVAAEKADSSQGLSLEEQQAALEQKLKEINSKLDSLGQQSKETEEYINALDERIEYLKKELTLSQQQIDNSQDKIQSLQNQHKENEETLKALKVQIEEMAVESEKLQQEFDLTFDEYGERAKALYISGNTSMIELLLTCDDISSFLTRLEMIKRVAVSDKTLLQELMDEGEKILALKNEMEEKQTSISNTQKTLEENEISLQNTIKDLEAQQVTYKDKQSQYESEKSESDKLLQKLHQQTKTYSEYRNSDLEDLAAINAEIEVAAEKYKEELEQSQNKPSTTTPSGSGSQGQTTTTKPSSSKLSMTYPVPSQTTITTGYGSAGYAGHTGVDFACNSGAKVVAAESGIVIISKDITYHSPCSCSNTGGGYHSYGRYIVIMHDKKNSSGNYVYTLYAHNSSRVVEEGDRVSKGQLIAYAGSTGNSTGPHCHFEVRTPDALYEHCVNPVPYLP